MKDKPALCIQGMARKFVRESIIEDAAARLVAQIMTEIADAHIAPRDAEITSLRSQLEEARAKAIEEAAQVAERHTGMNASGNMEYGPNMPKLIAFDIRALLNGITNKEGGKS